jgi:cellobiose phosphorylase
MLPDDPFFLIGNYRLTLFTHASGLLQVLSGERAWARLNDGGGYWSGLNKAACVVNGSRHELIGVDEPSAERADKLFGVGFARYAYQLPDGMKVQRSIHVRPSTKPGDGSSAFLVHVHLENTSTRTLDIDYEESVLANYRMLSWGSADRNAPTYSAMPAQKIGTDAISVGFKVDPHVPLTFPSAGQMCKFEQYPPALFVSTGGNPALRPHVVREATGHSSIGVQHSGALKPGETRELSFIVGYTRTPSEQSIKGLVASLHAETGSSVSDGSAFASEWRKAIPRFDSETDKQMRREMQWNVAVLEAMATWREYYDETIIPQGCMYDYVWGVVASNRDQAQQALPLCHTNPALARSTLRYILKRTVPDGEIKLMDQGFGWVASTPMQTSDQQLYFFILLNEYLRATGDTGFLAEHIGYYPLQNAGSDTVFAHVRENFLFLRDRISVGRHGLVRLWNSDWNDLFYAWTTKGSYNSTFETAESLMNTAMALAFLQDLQAHLRGFSHPKGAELADAMLAFRTELLGAWMRDLGDRPFPRRAWTDATTSLGEDNMWLEPQGFALMIPEMGVERKQVLLQELTRRLLDPEKMGARQIERPLVHPGTPEGSRENGGFWYALHGPLVLGAATINKSFAKQLLKRMTFSNYAKNFPKYWTGMWSASDSLDSSLLPTEGLSVNIPYCAHAHAWPLYCYLRLSEMDKPD